MAVKQTSQRSFNMYKIIKGDFNLVCAIKLIENNSFIPLDPANTDYQTFKAQILADEAELQDADGNMMTAEEAKTFVATLP